MVECRYTSDELKALDNLVKGHRRLIAAYLAKKLIEDGLIRESRYGGWAITDAGRRVIGEA